MYIYPCRYGKDGGGVYVFSLLMFTRSVDNVPQANIVKERKTDHACMHIQQTIFMLLPVIFVNTHSHSSTYMIHSLSHTLSLSHTHSLLPSVAIALSRRVKEK